MKKRAFTLLLCFYNAAEDVVAHDGIEHAGYLAFLILLSVFPFLVFLTALASSIANMIDQYNFSRSLLLIAVENVPHDVISGLLPRINEIISGPPQQLLTLAIVGAIWTSSSAVEGMRTILNRALRVSVPPPYILRRLLSIFQFLIITCVITAAMISITLVPFVLNIFNSKFGYAKYIISESILFLSVSWLYFMLPNTKQKLIAVVPGAFVVTLLWTCSAIAFTCYLETFKQLNLIYGSLAGIIVSLLFFYILGVFFVYGAELNYHLKSLYK